MTLLSQRTRILIIGPVPPLRGGIALHTNRLAQALMRSAEVRVQSFARLYPSSLFPGAVSRVPKTSVTQNGTPPISYHIDALNALGWSSAIDEARAFAPDFAIIPWWTVYVFPCLWSLGVGLRRAGIPLVLMCHNIADHEHSAWKRWLSHRMLRLGDLHIVHGAGDRDELLHLLPAAKVQVYRHPPYDHYPAAIRQLPRRAVLELLFYGFVRRYKGLPVLIEALSLIPDIDFHLSVVGEFWIDERAVRDQARRLGVADRIEFVPRYVDEADTACYFERADAVLLPYLGATGSGVASLAQHYGKPVIASRIGGLADYVLEGRTGLFATTGDAGSLAESLRRFAHEDRARWSVAIAEVRRSVSWERMAELIVKEGCALRSPSIHDS